MKVKKTIRMLFMLIILAVLYATHASASTFEYDFTKMGLLFSDEQTSQPDDHAHHLRLVGNQTAVNPAVYGTAFIARIYSTLEHPSRTFEIDVPEDGLYIVSLRGALSIDGGYADVYLGIDGEPNDPVKLFSEFDFYKHDAGNYRVLETEEAIFIPAGTHTLTFEVKGKSVGAGTVHMLPNSLMLKTEDEASNPVTVIDLDFTKASLSDPSTGWYLTRLNPNDYPRVTIQADGIQLGTSMRVPVRSFSFHVEKEGMYMMDFTGNLRGSSGAADIYLDTDDNEQGGTKLIEHFNFNRTDTATTRKVTSPDPVYLSEGLHKITFQLLNDGPGSTVGYIYPKWITFTELENMVTPTNLTFDLVEPEDLTFTMTTYDENTTLTAITHGSIPLQEGTDYIVDGREVIISQTYLLDQALGMMNLVFEFDHKNDVVVNINVEDRFAAQISDLSVTAAAEKVTVRGKIDSGANQQMTILIRDPHGNLEYVNQQLSRANGLFEFTYTKSRHAEGEYTVRIGGERVRESQSTTFTYSR